MSSKARSRECFYFFRSSTISQLRHHQKPIFFADDALLYRHIGNDEDARLLQQDHVALQQWEIRWQMKFHPEKCQVIRICTNKRYQPETTYKLYGHILQAVDSTKYLGVTISDDIPWRTHRICHCQGIQDRRCDCVHRSFTLFRDRMECERSGTKCWFS